MNEKRLEKVCLPCRARVCRIHKNHTHGYTEAECAVMAAELGFEIVAKGETKPVPVSDLRKVVKKQWIDGEGYVHGEKPNAKVR